MCNVMHYPQDADKRLTEIVTEAFQRQFKDLYLEQYLYYRPTEVGEPGVPGDIKFLSPEEDGVPDGYQLASPTRFPRHMEEHQVYNLYRPVVWKLPILY